jgi:AcrR family transcriptional regulator
MGAIMAVGQVNANDPRVKRTRKLLQQTMLELMGEKNFDAITVQDIAVRSTLNRATFYAHFEDKYDLLDSIIREGIEQELTAAVPEGAPVSAETLRALCCTAYTYLAQVQDHCKPQHHRQFSPLLERAVQEALHRFLVRWLRQAPAVALPGDAPAETVAGVLSWALFGTASQWSRGLRAEPAEVVAAQVVAVLIEGLGASFATP